MTVFLRALVVVAIACLPSAASARSVDGPLADYTVRTWNENDGLPAGRIRAIAQDPDGYLWLATDAGLVRFDGVRFDTWSTLGETRLPAGAVTTLISARDRSLWIGVSGRLPLGRIKDGKVTLFGERDGFAERSYTLSLLEDHEGTIWVGTIHGLFRRHGDRWERIGEEDGLGDVSTTAIYEDRQKRLWVSTVNGVFRKEGGDRFEQVDVITVSSNVWQGFTEDTNGTVWISDFNEGFRVPGLAAPRGRKPLRGWGVELLHDRRGNLWVGTQGQGLWRVRDRDGSSSSSVDMITTDDGVASNAVYSLLEDREGNIWVGTLSGLQRLTPHRVTPVKDLPIPRAIEVTPDGSVWIGTAAGLARLNSKGRTVYTETDGLPGSVVLGLYTDERGALWVSGERGVARFADGHFSPLLMVPGGGMQRIISMTGAGDTIWLRDFYSRLFRWRHEQLTSADDLPEAQRRSASFIYASRSGNLWIGSSGGRLVLRSPKGDVRTYEPGIGFISCMLEDAHGVVWVGGEDGLGRFADGVFTRITRQNGFTGDVKSLVEDELGYLWVGNGSGILRLDTSEIDKVAANPAYQVRFRLFNTSDGVAGVPFSEGSRSGVRSPDGRLWFITSSGVTIVDPRNIGQPLAAPSVKIESIAADGRSFDPALTLQLPARTSHLQIGFAALTLSDPMRVRYRYRLDGYDNDWVDAGPARQATYTNLPPRPYQFRVMASGGDGSWGEASSALAFSIQPMFYQTGWFYLVCGAVVFLIVYLSWRLHVRQVRRQFALVLAERIRMSRAIHDTLLQGLAALALQVDDLSHDTGLSSQPGRNRIVAIRRQVEGYIRQARRSIMDLRTPTLATGDLPQAIREAAELAIGGRPVALDVTVKGTPHACAALVEEQLVLIGQEAVNNAVRHGQARRVAVEIDYQGDRTSLRVADDGIGFDPEAASTDSGHYGLVSMRERAEQVRGRITIASRPGSGTEIEAVVPA